MSSGGSSGTTGKEKEKEKARVSRTSLILWHAHQNDAAAVRKLLEEDPSLVRARDYDNRTPLHVASLHGWVEVANCLIEFGADVNAQDRWKNTPLADAEGAKGTAMIELLESHGGLSYGQNGSHFEPKPVLPPLPNKCDWEVDPNELDFSSSICIGKGSFGEIVRAHWRGTPVAVKRILPSLSDDRLVIQDFRHEVNLLVKLRHPNVVQFLGAVTDKKPLMLITEYLRGGDLHKYLKDKGTVSPSTAINFALDIARGMAYLHNEPNVIIHRDLKPRNVLLVNSSADHLKVGDFGLSKLIKVQSSHDVYKMTDRYMAPEVFKHRRYDKKVDVFSFAMILYEMLEGEPPFSSYEPYEGAKYVAEGHRPSFRAKGYTPELRDLTEHCWAADMNQRPSFIDILAQLDKIKGHLPSDHHWSLSILSRNSDDYLLLPFQQVALCPSTAVGFVNRANLENLAKFFLLVSLDFPFILHYELRSGDHPEQIVPIHCCRVVMLRPSIVAKGGGDSNA
ncbi:Serine/threonine-protein kinase STY8, partial [Mucuna pruriens]